MMSKKWVFTNSDLRLIELVLLTQGHTGQDTACEKCTLYNKVMGILTHRARLKTPLPGRAGGRPPVVLTPSQINRIRALKESKVGVNEIVRREGVSYRKVREALANANKVKKVVDTWDELG